MKALKRRLAKIERTQKVGMLRFRILYCLVGETPEAAKQRFNEQNPDDPLLETDGLIMIVPVAA